MITTTARLASKKQVAFLRQLAKERDIHPDDMHRLLTRLDHYELYLADPTDPDGEKFEFETADKSIKWLLAKPVKSGVVPNRIAAMPEVKPGSVRTTLSGQGRIERELSRNSHQRRDPKTLPTSGVFRRDGETYVVVPSRRNPGRHYAMRMVASPNRLTSSGETVNFDYVKDPGAIWSLYEEHRLPAEAVEALMIQYQVCIYPGCGRTLKAAKSVARGAGKVHARRLGLI